MMTIGLRLWRLGSHLPAAFLLAGLLLWPPSAPAAAQTPAGIRVMDAGGAEVRTLSADAIAALPTAHIHTATPWSERADYEGPLLTDVIRLAAGGGTPPGAMPSGTVLLGAADDYTVRIPLADVERLRPILAYRQDGRPLSLRTRGPYWLIFPFDDTPAIQNDLWYYRAIWQITRLSLLP